MNDYPDCDHEFNPDFISEEEREPMCLICDGNGYVAVNQEGQTREEASDEYPWHQAGCKICPSCGGPGRHLGMAE